MESLQYLKSTRSKLHSIAELSMKEYNTSAFIENELKSFGLKPRKIGTGIYCDLCSDKRKIAFRADMDALPIEEKTCRADKAEGVMHACGHDGHMANLLNTARILKDEKLPVRFIFQPGEEGYGGAADMCEQGVLDGVSEIYALHLNPDIPAGKFGVTYGAMFAGAVEFNIDFIGKSAHCAKPELGVNALKIGLKAFDAFDLQAKKQDLLLNLGVLNSGRARNIIPDRAHFEYSLRYYDCGKRDGFMTQAEKICLALDDEFSCEHRTDIKSVYLPVINGAYGVDRVRSVTNKDDVIFTDPYLTAEDFSEYLNKVTGCMVWLGVRDEAHDSPLHADTFDFDERALIKGTELFVNLARTYERRR